MRTILAFFLALMCVLFGFQNQTPIDILIGPYEIQGSVAIVLISTFMMGVFTGIMASLPGNLKRRRILRTLSD